MPSLNTLCTSAFNLSSIFFGWTLVGLVTGVVEEVPDFGSGAVVPTAGAGAFFFRVEVPVGIPFAGLADVPEGEPGTLFDPDGFFVVGVVVVFAAPAGLAAGFATDGFVESPVVPVVPAVAPAAEFASAGLSGTDGRRCARISEARM